MMMAPQLIFGIFVAISTAALLARIPNKPAKLVASAVLMLLIAAPSYKEIPNYLTIKTSNLAVDRDLLHFTKKMPGGIIHIPIEASGGDEHIQQLFHNQPIINGPGMDVIREKRHADYCQKNSILDAMEYMAKYDVVSTPLHNKDDLSILYRDGFRFFYLDTRRVQSSKEDFLQLLGTDKAYTRGHHIAIPIPDPGN